jgi:hypothetical protein
VAQRRKGPVGASRTVAEQAPRPALPPATRERCVDLLARMVIADLEADARSGAREEKKAAADPAA